MSNVPHPDVQIEPVPGLPHALPAGEHLVWQGAPRWRKLARHVFLLPWVSAYLLALVVVQAVQGFAAGGAARAFQEVLPVLAVSAVCVGVLCLLAWSHARASLYTITSHRVVMRLGVAFPITFNLPFRRLASANVHARPAGDGDIVLELAPQERLAFAHLWPHTRPWRLTRAQPMLRCVADAQQVADALGNSVRRWAETNQASVTLGGPREQPLAPHTMPLSFARGSGT